MAWGGSINFNGTNCLRKLREIEKVLKFLEDFKKELGSKDVETINKTIDIIVDYSNTLSEGKSL